MDPYSSSAIHLLYNPPGEDKHVKKLWWGFSAAQDATRSCKVYKSSTEVCTINNRLPNHSWIYHLSKHTYKFQTLKNSCMFCSVSKGNGFAMLLCTTQSVTQSNCIIIFGDEVLRQGFWKVPLWLSEMVEQISIHVSLRCLQLYIYNLQADPLRPCQVHSNGTTLWSLPLVCCRQPFCKVAISKKH